MFVLGILLAYSLPYPSVDFATLLPILTFLGTLCSVSGAGLVASLHLYRKKSRVEVIDEGVVFGGRLVRWGDVEDVKVWSESFREAEVESSPVIGYGMYGYAVGRTLPSTLTYRSHKFVALQFFPQERHRDSILCEPRVLAIREGCIGNAGLKGRNSRVASEAYRKPWKLVGWPTPIWVSIMNSKSVA
jgi:hypothetical protein